MSTIQPPIVDISGINASVANSGNFNGVEAAPARPSSFLQPNLLSWINTPYYHLPIAPQRLQNAAPIVLPAENTAEAQEQAQVASEQPVSKQNEYCQETPAPAKVENAPTLAGLDLQKLEPSLQEVACDNHINHVQQVISFFQKGGDSAKTFGKIFLNDLNMQKTIISALMNEPGNPLSQINFLHKELALRLASCYQARQVAQLLLADV